MPESPHTAFEWLDRGLTAIGAGGLTLLIDRWRSRRRMVAETSKLEAEADIALAGAWRQLVGELRSELADVRERVARAEQRADELEKKLLGERRQHKEELEGLRERIRHLEKGTR